MRLSRVQKRGFLTLFLTALFLWSGIASSLRLGGTPSYANQNQSPAPDEENEEEAREEQARIKGLRQAQQVTPPDPETVRESHHEWAVRTYHVADHAHAPTPRCQRPNLPRRLI